MRGFLFVSKVVYILSYILIAIILIAIYLFMSIKNFDKYKFQIYM